MVDAQLSDHPPALAIIASPCFQVPAVQPETRVTVVCVTYQSAAIVPTLALTLARFAHVIVVDNASDDGTVAALQRHCVHAQVLAQPRNLGFGAANNRALQEVRTEFALLLNPDCAIDADNLARLLACADRFPRAALIAPQAYQGERAQVSYNSAYFERRARSAYQVPEGPTCARFLIACSLLVRMAALGPTPFDERYFLYCEDDDLCLEAWARGFECLLEPAANVQHVGGGSSRPTWRVEYLKGYHHALSRRLFVRKHVGAAADWRLRLRHLALAPLAMIVFAVTGRRLQLAKWVGRVAQALR